MIAPVTTELVTAENLDVERYLACNADVARFVAGGGDARTHLIDYGIKEGRRQLTQAAWDAQRAGRGERYPLFRSVLRESELRFCDAAGRFPVAHGEVASDFAVFAHEPPTAAYHPFLEEMRAHPEKLYADIGCGQRTSIVANCLYVDDHAAPSADLIVADPARLPIADGSLDGIGCSGLLSRVAEPWRVAAELRRILKPGGVLYLEWAQLLPAGDTPGFHANRAAVERLFDGMALSFEPALQVSAAKALTAGLDRALADLAQGDPALHARLLAMPLRDFVYSAPSDPLWQEIAQALSPGAARSLAAGNLLVARNP